MHSLTAWFLLCNISAEAEGQTNLSDDEGDAPGHRQLIDHEAERAAVRVQLAADGGQRCDAGRIEQAEHEEGVGCQRREQARQIRRTAAADGEHGKRADDNLLRRYAADKRGGCLPVAKAERRKNRRCQLAKRGNNAGRCIDHIKAGVEVLQKPDDDADDEDDREGLMQKVLGLFPHMHDDVAGGGQAVGRQLHDEGHRLAAEDEAVEQKSGDDGHADADEVEREHHQATALREEGSDEHAVDGQLGAAAHERREHNGHFAVTLTGECTRGHDSRHAAAEADNHRHEGRAGETDFAQQLVHDEGDTRHIAAVLEHREEEEQRDDGRQKGEHGAYAGEDAVDNQRMHGRRDIQLGQAVVRSGRDSVDDAAEDVA